MCAFPMGGDVSSDTLRWTRDGQIVGFVGHEGCHTWLGIPFAQPPVDDLRWRAPKPLHRRERIYAANYARPIAAQVNVGGLIASHEYYVGSEDCLHLNIWAPAYKPDNIPQGEKSLPVFVFIHGGANVGGDCTEYDGSALAVTEGMLVVSVNYRLGIFGWFRHPALNDCRSGPFDASGNFGTLDLIAALKWVQENISFFGGNPDCVTICGVSAGGNNVLSLLVAPLARGLFHRAAIHSSVLLESSIADGEQHIDDDIPGKHRSSGEVTLQLLQMDGIAKDRNAARLHVNNSSSHDISRYLRSKSFADFDGVLSEIGKRDPSGWLPQLFSDGAVLPAGGIKAACLRGAYAVVPIILGAARDEDRTLLAFNPKFSEITMTPRMRVKIADKGRFDIVASYLSQVWRAQAVDEWVGCFSAFQNNLFAYCFDWQGAQPAPWLDNAKSGASHGMEMPFLSGFRYNADHLLFKESFDGVNTLDVSVLAKSMMSYWAEFAHCGNPGSGRRGELQRWPAWERQSTETLLILDTPSGGGIRTSDEKLNRKAIIDRLKTDERLAKTALDRSKLHADILSYPFLYGRIKPSDFDN